MRALVIVTALAAGCIARQEIREQHCAHICIDTYGVNKQTGIYGSYTKGDRCYCVPWRGHGRTRYEGHIGDAWRPE